LSKSATTTLKLTDRFTLFFVGSLAFGKEFVVEQAAGLNNGFHRPLLRFGWVDALLKSFNHRLSSILHHLDEQMFF